MGLFRSADPWQEGIRSSAVVERVVVTATDDSDDHGGAHNQYVHLTFRFTDEHGADTLVERKCKVGIGNVPPPGTGVDIAYLPDKASDSLVFAQRPYRAPDPSVPRGWGAGIFELPDLGGHRAKAPLARHEVDQQRELFRRGRRAQAEVLTVTRGAWRKRATSHYTFTLRVDGTEVTAKAWVPRLCVPEPGDLIQVAIDGDEVALDTDERYDGPPGQALVFTTPPERLEQRQAGIMATQPGVGEAMAARAAALRAAAAAPAGPPAMPGPAMAGMIDMQLSALKLGRGMMGGGYETTVRQVLDGARAAGIITEAEHADKLRQALA
ncbi:MAG: hypothetical protein QOI80_2423 [Solirubrobacteraceae bacterium]|nr:hypothetical protein [Solirubrobacteraceae bacterium]